ncbi:MAG: outer membrane protein assembly factor BamE [Leptothrix sp. (in: b-proteobacteria)]
MKIKTWIAAGALVVLAGCAGTPFQWDDARKLEVGMTQQQVQALMGTPYLVRSTAAGVQWTWSHANLMTGSNAVSVMFVDGKLASVPQIPDGFR